MFGEYDGDEISESEWNEAERQVISDLLDAAEENKGVIKLIVSMPQDPHTGSIGG